MREDDAPDDALDGLLETAVLQTFDAVIFRAQRNDEDARAFLHNYKDYYLSDQRRPSYDLCLQMSKHLDKTLADDPACLYPATRRWCTALSFGCGIMSPFLLIANPWYAAGALAGAGLLYLGRRAAMRASRRKAAELRALVSAQPEALAAQLEDAREYMGYELFAYGALDEHQIKAWGSRPKRRKRRRHAHNGQRKL